MSKSSSKFVVNVLYILLRMIFISIPFLLTSQTCITSDIIRSRGTGILCEFFMRFDEVKLFKLIFSFKFILSYRSKLFRKFENVFAPFSVSHHSEFEWKYTLYWPISGQRFLVFRRYIKAALASNELMRRLIKCKWICKKGQKTSNLIFSKFSHGSWRASNNTSLFSSKFFPGDLCKI